MRTTAVALLFRRSGQRQPDSVDCAPMIDTKNMRASRFAVIPGRERGHHCLRWLAIPRHRLSRSFLYISFGRLCPRDDLADKVGYIAVGIPFKAFFNLASSIVWSRLQI